MHYVRVHVFFPEKGFVVLTLCRGKIELKSLVGLYVAWVGIYGAHGVTRVHDKEKWLYVACRMPLRLQIQWRRNMCNQEW